MSRRPSLRPLAFTLAAGLFLVLAGLPRLIGGVQLIDQDLFMPRFARWIPDAPPPPPSEVAEAGERWRRAALHFRDGALRAELGDIRLAQWREARDPEFKAAALEAAIQAYRDAVRQYPAQPRAWTQLANALYYRDGPGPVENALLKMAIRTGAGEPSLVIARIDLGFANWKFLDGEARALVEQQIVFAARWRPRDLADYALRRFRLKSIREALKPVPDALRRFDDAWRSLLG